MKSKKEIKKQCDLKLRYIIDEYREENPDDTRSDTELLHWLMGQLVEADFIIEENGKHTLPEIIYDA